MLDKNGFISFLMSVLLRQPSEAILGENQHIANQARLLKFVQLISRVLYARHLLEVVHDDFGEGEGPSGGHDILKGDGLSGLLGCKQLAEALGHLLNDRPDGWVVWLGQHCILA